MKEVSGLPRRRPQNYSFFRKTALPAGAFFVMRNIGVTEAILTFTTRPGHSEKAG